MRIKSVSVSISYSEDWQPSEYISKLSDRPGYLYPGHLVFKVDIENDKFRIESDVEGTKVHPKRKDSVNSEIVAFDMHKYQRFTKKDAYLRVQTKRINLLTQMNYPLTKAYQFLFYQLRHEDRTFENIQRKEIWDNVKKQSKFIEDSIVEGYDCIATEISYPDIDRFARVYWAKELRYYPVKYELFDLKGKKIVDRTTKQVLKYDTPKGPVFISMVSVHTEWHSTAGHKLWTLTQTINKKSLTINEDIPDDIFTIPVHLARSYVNADDPNQNYSPDATCGGN
jgi:hypothetical protein